MQFLKGNRRGRDGMMGEAKTEEVVDFGKKFIMPLGEIDESQWKNALNSIFSDNVVNNHKLHTSLLGFIVEYKPDKGEGHTFAVMGLQHNSSRGVIVSSDKKENFDQCPCAKEVAKFFDL